jgi:hypothetical protein
VTASIGTVGKNRFRIVWQCRGTGLAVIHIGGRNRNILHKRRIRIGADLGLEAMNGGLALVLDPMRVTIAFAGGCDNRRIYERTGFDLDRLILALS